MDENNSTEITEVIESGEQPEVVDQENETQDDFALVDEESTAEQSDAVDQTPEDNHAAKLARLSAQRDARKREEQRKAEEDREWAECEAINPITGNPFRSKKEFFEYNAEVKKANQQKRAEASGRTVTEIEEEDADRDFIRKIRQKESETQSREAFMEDDLINFVQAHPDVDVVKLDNNTQFREYCGSRYGKESLASLYEGYQKLVKNAEQSFKADTRQLRGTGSGANGGERMTAEQKRNLDAWNAAFPEMKMSPSEFMRKK